MKLLILLAFVTILHAEEITGIYVENESVTEIRLPDLLCIPHHIHGEQVCYNFTKRTNDRILINGWWKLDLLYELQHVEVLWRRSRFRFIEVQGHCVECVAESSPTHDPKHYRKILRKCKCEDANLIHSNKLCFLVNFKEICYQFLNTSELILSDTSYGWYPGEVPVPWEFAETKIEDDDSYDDDGDIFLQENSLIIDVLSTSCSTCVSSKKPPSSLEWKDMIQPLLECNCIMKEEDKCLREKNTNHLWEGVSFESVEDCVKRSTEQFVNSISFKLNFPDSNNDPTFFVSPKNMIVNIGSSLQLLGNVSLNRVPLHNPRFLEFVLNFEYYQQLFDALEVFANEFNFMRNLPEKKTFVSLNEQCKNNMEGLIKSKPSFVNVDVEQLIKDLC